MDWQVIQLTGPMGGALAAAFASGCVSTYVFMMRAVKEVRAQLAAEVTRCNRMEERLVRRIENLELLTIQIASPQARHEVSRQIDRTKEREGRTRDLEAREDQEEA